MAGARHLAATQENGSCNYVITVLPYGSPLSGNPVAL